jgi:cytochrome d ubiquinol oxidase subunit II
METLWFWLVALMLTAYVTLDGFDLGAGAVYPFVARTDQERRTVLQSIGPVWDANEVWLIAAGGSLLLAFPPAFASGFSGFYLPLMMALWLLVLRAVSIEFRSHLSGRIWRPFWDAVFSGASLLLTVVLGAALGNVVRGVPLGEDGYFFSPLWTTFGGDGERTGILDPYTVSVGVTSMLALAHHGALWISLRTEGALRARAREGAARLWPVLVVAVLGVTLYTFRIQPHVPGRLGLHPEGYLFPLLALAGLVGSRWMDRRQRESGAFLGSALFLVGMMASVCFTLYPIVLPSTVGAGPSLTVDNASSPARTLTVALYWWIPGMVLVSAYTTFIYRRMSAKVSVSDDGY